MNRAELPAGMITRFAPSLTGFLHLGHVLHMIYVWGIARATGGSVLCRMEDHDLSRRRPEYEEAILADMEWLGFVPDQGLSLSTVSGVSDFRQSNCADLYEAALAELVEQGWIYGCECSRKEIQARQPAEHDELCYSGTCSQKNLPLAGHTVRFRVPDGEVVFEDILRGTVRQDPRRQCGDFSLRDRTGQWTYQFCCMCDDIRQGVNLVVRGEDILSSTGRQIQLLRAFGRAVPAYVHHPLLVDGEGRKLSKRQRSESITQLCESGVSPEEIVGQAAFAGGLIAEFRPLRQPELQALWPKG